MNYKLKDINKYFKLPIQYVEDKNKISQNIKDDLELTTDEHHESIYKHLFHTDSNYSKITSELWADYYTYDKKFLKESQSLIKNFKNNQPICEFSSWETIKKETSFIEKYNYIDFEYFQFMNKSSPLLQVCSIYQFTSPIFALIYPVLIAIVPFLLLKFQGIPITIAQYLQFIKLFLYNTSFYQLFSSFSIHNLKSKLYALFSVCFYLFGIYQNISSCIHFYFNMKNVNNYICELSSYLNDTLKHIQSFKPHIQNLSSYKPFLEEINKHENTLSYYYNYLNKVTPYSWNYHNLSHMGYSMKYFHDIFYNEELHKSMMFSFGFLGYIQNIYDIQDNLKNKHINFVKFSNKTAFKNAYYAPFKNNKHIKNTYNLKKKIIISGPNASGKTTILKTTLFNVLLSQQIGVGFFQNGTIKIYSHIHCYLNIPDTSDRDSLFQAEARRCREIISSLHENKKSNHFCIFDELYSGTNPYEAIASAYSFINYLKNYNIDFMLTTHYVELCNNLNEKPFISNKKMLCDTSNTNIKYLYKLDKGISTYKGGVQVLRNLDYPPELITNTIKYLNK